MIVGWVELVTAGDGAMQRGDFHTASTTYGELLERLTSAIPVSDSHDALLRGAVTHRLGVAAIAAGAEGDAPSHFSAADEAFAEAKALAKGLVMTEWIDEVTQQSYDARLALLDQPDLRPSMYATCAHGCPSITQRCRYKYDHC